MKKIIAIIFLIFFLTITQVHAAETTTLLSESIETDSLKGFIQVALAVSSWILGIVGSLSLLVFIYGGVKFLASAGRSEWVEDGKKAIIGAVIGLIIVFASYTIINFVLQTTGVTDSSGKFVNTEVNSGNWNTAPTK